jgi:hypothetical protein
VDKVVEDGEERHSMSRPKIAEDDYLDAISEMMVRDRYQRVRERQSTGRTTKVSSSLRTGKDARPPQRKKRRTREDHNSPDVSDLSGCLIYHSPSTLTNLLPCGSRIEVPSIASPGCAECLMRMIGDPPGWDAAWSGLWIPRERCVQ